MGLAGATLSTCPDLFHFAGVLDLVLRERVQPGVARMRGENSRASLAWTDEGVCPCVILAIGDFRDVYFG